MNNSLYVYHFIKDQNQSDFDLLETIKNDFNSSLKASFNASTTSCLNPENQSLSDVGGEFQDVIHFETCLRKIWISSLDLSLLMNPQNSFSKVEVLHDEFAYQFLLEVLCGLKSPVIGETEVFGQFKNQVLKSLNPKHALNKVLNLIVSDTKTVRSRHLTNLGSSSYGSLARKYLSDYKSLDILGAGQFVQSLKPWIEKLNIKTSVYTREPKKYFEAFKNSKWSLSSVSIYSPDSSETPKALFICAPIDLKTYDLSVYDLVIDFRDLSTLNEIQHKNLKVLVEIFQEIEKDNKLALLKKEEALLSVKNASQMYIATMNHRPFGWDDLSA